MTDRKYWEIDIYNPLWMEWRNVDTVFEYSEIAPAVEIVKQYWKVPGIRVTEYTKKEIPLQEFE
ncbi:hypothetical protein [Caulobacter phage Cr30]|uniref:hypothetical protein n=1 Tax=Caulobacter phage Cr30 TaxID=1357714 RepID=UPI0004A9B80D|nr:hypothetical protein OZ74_gp029 [Caulobacter phage Cr30]AGS80914.1 hypothetical protein [Caulobacter phage Cr30]